MFTPVPGNLLHVTMNDGTVRGMIVTAVFKTAVTEGMPEAPPMLNGTVFIDGENDLARPGQEGNLPQGIDVVPGGAIARAWSRHYSNENVPGTWCWPKAI